MKRISKISRDNKCGKDKKSYLCSVLQQHWIGILLVLFLFTSCVSPVGVSVNILRPSAIGQKFNLDSVAIVNNCGKWDSFTYRDTLVYPAAADKLVEVLAQKLANSDEFKYVIRVDSCLAVPDSMHVHVLTDSVSRQICADWGVSSIISVDLAYAKIPLVSNTGRGDVFSNVVFSVYEPGSSDSIQSYTGVSNFFYPGTTIKEDMLEDDLADVLSDEVKNRLSSYWSSVGRILYTSLASDLRYGYLAYTSGKYDEARKLWSETANSSSIRKYRVAAFINLAFLDEMEDHYSDALINLDKAEEAMDPKHYTDMSNFIASYRKILRDRQRISETMK